MPDPQRILVVQPSWVGDAAMATPALRAIRRRFPDAHISYWMRRYLKPLYGGAPWADRLLTHRPGERLPALAARLRAGRFDLAILLPNSFAAALLARTAGIRRVVGYDRDGRGFLLSDKLLPPRDRGPAGAGRFTPTPTLRYYLGLAQYLGARADGEADRRIELFVTPADRANAARSLERAGLDPSLDRPGTSGGGGPLVILNPGAKYGAAKLWPADRFAAVGDRLVESRGATVLVSGSPAERRIVAEVIAAMRRPAADLTATGLTLGGLKDIVRRCDLMVTNDTGPRHLAAAFGTPVVTVFGPTDPAWTVIDFPRERQVMEKVFCGPCQLKECPLDHRCMTRIVPDRVHRDALTLLDDPRDRRDDSAAPERGPHVTGRDPNPADAGRASKRAIRNL